MDPTSRTYPPGDLRVSDADRDAVLSELSEHFQAGRLTAAEFDDRAGQALAARTGKELADLMSDLPSVASGPPGPSGPPVLADASSGTGAGVRRTAGHPAAMATAVALAGIGAVIAVAAIAGGGHWHGRVSVPWGLILVAFLIFRCMTRGSRRHGR